MYRTVCSALCVCSLFSCVSHYYVVEFLTLTWLKGTIQCVSNVINMLIKTAFLFK